MAAFPRFVWLALPFWFFGFIFFRNYVKANPGKADIYGNQMLSGLPLAGTMSEMQPGFNQLSADCNLVSSKTFMNKADSGISYTIPDRRKRPTDSFNELNALTAPQKRSKASGLPSLIDQEVIFQAQQQQQAEIDRFFAQYVIFYSLLRFPFF